MNDLISRKDAIDALDGEITITGRTNAEAVKGYVKLVKDRLEQLPSAQPETDGFCDGCKEYDQERHFCPRFDRVIKTTVEEMQIIHCKDCRKHNVHSGYKEDCCPLYEWRGVSYGHEHDYQYCVFAEIKERREE